MKMPKQSVINTFNRVGIPYEELMKQEGTITVHNRFGGGSCETSPLVAFLISWVYNISDRYELGDTSVKVSDFDRVRYYILEIDQNAYSTCVD